MSVTVDKPRQNGTPLEIDFSCDFANCGMNFRVRPDGAKPAVLDRKCGHNRKIIIDSDDLAIGENQISTHRHHADTVLRVSPTVREDGWKSTAWRDNLFLTG